MPFKMTSRGEEYVPRGWTVDPCPGCGKDHKRPKDKVCDVCEDAITKWNAHVANQAELGEEKPYAMNARAHSLPYIQFEGEGRAYGHSDREPLRSRFFELSMLLSTPSDATWTDKPERLWPNERMKATYRMDDYLVYRNMKPAIAKLLGDLYFEVGDAVQMAHRKGVEEGKNLLLSLASGHITNDEFNTKAARLTGEKDEE
jgi:hypothetical protein